MKRLTSLFLFSIMLGNALLFNIQMVYAQDATADPDVAQTEVQPDLPPAADAQFMLPQIIQNEVKSELPAILEATDTQFIDGTNANVGLSEDVENVSEIQRNVKDENIQSRVRAGINNVSGSVPKTEPAIPTAPNAIPTDPLASLKGLNGNFSTDLFTGAAVFSYDFWLPQGRGAAQPVLSLRYSSHNRNFSSFVGYGWSLPTNGIFRSTPRGVDNLYDDSVFSADIFGNTEELILTNSGQGLYSPKIEGSFVEYKYANNSWVATDTRGTKYFFGSSENAKQSDPNDSSRVYKWLLDKAEDTNGNYLTMTYFHDQGQVYPKTIRYSGHGADEGIYEIVFNWEQRSRQVTSYAASFKVATAYRLVSIDIVSHGAETPKTARSYFFEYNTTGKIIETLKSVIISDGAVSLPPLSFEYYDGSDVDQKIHLLKKITNIHGGTTELRYKPSTSYRAKDSKIANAHLPFNINTIHTIKTTDPSSGVSSTTTYDYSGGHYYYDFADAFKKEYAGFAQVTITDEKGNIAKHFFHQSEFSSDNVESETIGEYQDHISKKGRIYRTEVYDNSGNLFTVSIKKWDKEKLADDDSKNDKFFPYLSRQTDLQYDGTATAKTISSEYVYGDFGNVTAKTSYGEAAATNDAGDFTDIGNDKIITSYQYAQNISKHIISLPSLVESRDGANNIISRSKNYYDNLDLGNVNIGNLTKQEKYFDDTHFVTLLRGYNSYGLTENETDPRGNITSYGYDQFNLFPETVTNAKNQVASYVYDYLIGKVTQTADPNGQIFQTGYDGFGRKTEQRQPDLTNPAVLVVASSYVYNDTSLPASITQKNYLDDVNGVEQRTYLDGFDRAIQTKTETETANVYATKDIVYNNLGQVEKESLPYFSNGFAKTSKTANNNLYTSYVYDPLNRIVSSTNAVGTTLNSYDDWKVTTADAKNNIKTLESDAYGNLVKVEEHNEGEIYTTRYEYNLLGNLKKITDAKSNVRNFSYDYLGRLKFSDDLHAQDDATFGVINYDYDDAGNLIQKIDAKNETTIYGYDELNRIKTEDNTSKAGVEQSYVYDVCANGIGRLCVETNSDETTNYSYNALGLANIKIKNIKTENKQESYEYDRQGNIALTVYSDNSEAKNEYNAAGQIEKIFEKKDGEDSFSSVITKTDYNPLGQIKYQENANGVATANIYDENELYRLKNKKTEIIGALVAMNLGEGFSLAEVSSGVFKIPPTPLCERGENSKDYGGASASEGRFGSAGVSPQRTSARPNIFFSSSFTNFYQPKFLALGETNLAPSAPTVLQTEGQTNPLKVSDTTPEFSAIFNDPNTTDKAQYYQIQVIAEAGDFAAPLWDSTKKTLTKLITKGYRSGQISYGGTPLALNCAKYFWRMKFWDDDNTEGVWSNGADYFIMAEANIAPTAPSGLQTESQTNPLNVSDTAPEFSAIFNDPNMTDSAKYYRIQVITQTGNFNAPLWNSNKIALATPIAKGNRSAEISYGGTPLPFNGARYFWRMKFWDTAGAQGAWSDGSDYFMLEANLAPTAPSGLEAEGAVNPTNIIDTTPEFTAIFNDSNSTEFAKYYQVQVINEAGDFASPLWDSNKTKLTAQTAKGARSEEISYAGAPLALDGAKYLWRIKFWDDEDAEGEWSNGADYFTAAREPIRVDVLQDLSYTYDEVGNITKIVDASGTDSAKTSDFEYDDLYRLKKVTVTNAANGQNYTQTYDYDAIGNITNKSDVGDYLYEGNLGNSYANSHAVTSAGGKTYTYDKNGNLVSNGTWTHTWDYNNRLIQSTNGVKTISYGYDTSGNRVSKTDGVKTSYYFSQYYEVEDGKERKRIYSNNTLVATIENGNIYYVNADHLGGSSTITNKDGNMEQMLDYYPFGGIRINDQYGFDEKKKFTGHEHDDETGLEYMKARYYDSGVGRFMSQDAVYRELGDLRKVNNSDFNDKNYKDKQFEILMNPQRLNAYSYVSNNPLVRYDPFGLAEVYIRQAGPKNAMNIDWKSYGGHTMIQVDDTYYGFNLTPESNNDVQKLSESEFENEYKGQTWNVVNIGDKWDEQIINEFEALEQKGNTEEGTYRIIERNCTSVAWDVLDKVEAFTDKIGYMPKTFTSDQMLYQFKTMKIFESVYKFFDKKYEPLIKGSINKFTNPYE